MLKLVVVAALALVSADATEILLVTNNDGGRETLTADLTDWAAAGFDKDEDTMILVHGHGGSATTSLNPVVLDVLDAAELNIIIFDWASESAGTYSESVENVPDVAAILAEFIDAMIETGDADPEKIHIVGFDLGAHVAGQAGRALDTKIAKITGLDPSGSQWGTNSRRLNIDDATYVEVIHTDGSGILANGIGTAIGTIDFFVNGGNNQPGCITHTCCHERAYHLFAASFVNVALVGFKCSSNLQLSLNLCKGQPAVRIGTNAMTKEGTGLYRINTRRTFPF